MTAQHQIPRHVECNVFPLRQGGYGSCVQRSTAEVPYGSRTECGVFGGVVCVAVQEGAASRAPYVPGGRPVCQCLSLLTVSKAVSSPD